MGAQPNLNTQIIGGWPVLIPPIAEQRGLVARIKRETSLVDDESNRVARQIDLVREYRIRLIADVVTGKLDVREAAARIPNETDELESMDHTDVPAEPEPETEDGGLDNSDA
jgi:type I restriction enzyme, S subunit